MQDDESITQKHDALVHSVDFLSFAIAMQKEPEFRGGRQSRLQLRILPLSGVYIPDLYRVGCGYLLPAW